MRIAFFISSHGFGHGIRSCAVINALQHRGHQVFIFSKLNIDFFRQEVKGKIRLCPCELDCGCVQPDAVSVDVGATLAKYREIDRRREEILENFSRKLRESAVELVLADIPPLAFAIAERAGIPGYGISNFTWGDIYQPFLSEYPGFSDVFAHLMEDYARAEGYFSIYPDMPGLGFHRRRKVGTIARTGAPCRDQLAKLYDIDPSKKWCIIYLGAFGLTGVNWSRLQAYSDWQFLGLYGLAGSPNNYVQIRYCESLSYLDVMASCDLALGKLGYGLVGESLSLGLPVVFIERYNFSEFLILKRALLKEGLGYQIDTSRLMQLDITEALEMMSQRKKVLKRASGIEEILGFLHL